MSETATKSVTRYYVTSAGQLISRFNGVDTPIGLTGMSPEVERRAMVEGVVAALIKGAPLDHIISGDAFPVRRLPAGNAATPSDWVKAIGAVRTKEILKDLKDSGVKLTQQDRLDADRVGLGWPWRGQPNRSRR